MGPNTPRRKGRMKRLLGSKKGKDGNSCNRCGAGGPLANGEEERKGG